MKKFKVSIQIEVMANDAIDAKEYFITMLEKLGVKEDIKVEELKNA